MEISCLRNKTFYIFENGKKGRIKSCLEFNCESKNAFGLILKLIFGFFLPSMGVMLSNSWFGRRQENDSVLEKGGKKTLISNLSCTFPLWLWKGDLPDVQ